MEETNVPETYHMLPMGATRELGSHKGYGLSCMVDILAGVLTGTRFQEVLHASLDECRKVGSSGSCRTMDNLNVKASPPPSAAAAADFFPVEGAIRSSQRP